MKIKNIIALVSSSYGASGVGSSMKIYLVKVEYPTNELWIYWGV